MDVDEVLRRSRSGPAALFARRLFAVLISILTVVTVPHFVGPRAYGLAAMSTILFGLAEMFKDFGLTSAIMRRGEVYAEEVNFLFWFNFAMTGILAVLIALLAPAVAGYFHEPVVALVIYVSLIGFIIGGVALQHRAVISRELRFTTIALVDSLALLAQFVVTLTLAAIYHDVWSIVWGGVTSSVVSSLTIISSSGWKPGPPRMIKESRSILIFGANTSVYSLSVFFSTNLLAVLVGHFIGSAGLGQLNRASALVTLPQKNLVDPIAQAALPVLSRLRPSPVAYKRAYLDLVRSLNVIVVPASATVFAAAPSLTVGLLGSRWHLAGLLLQALAPSIAALGFGYAAGDLFVTQNRAAEMRTLGIVELFVRAVAVVVALHWGIVAAAYGFSLATLAIVGIRITVAGRRGPISAYDHISAAAPALPLGIGAMAGAYLSVLVASHWGLAAIPTAALTIALAGVAGLGVAAIFPASRTSVLKLLAGFEPTGRFGRLLGIRA